MPRRKNTYDLPMSEGDDGKDEGKRRRKLRLLTGLSVDEFRHPLDQRATAALKQVPGLDKLLAKILEVGLERMFYVDNIASNLRVTPKMSLWVVPRMLRMSPLSLTSAAIRRRVSRDSNAHERERLRNMTSSLRNGSVDERPVRTAGVVVCRLATNEKTNGSGANAL